MTPRFLLPAVLLALLAGVASAAQDEAETCVREQVWNAYPQGWAVRTIARADLGEGENRIYLLTLYAGMEYRILACGDPGAAEVDLVLYDADGLPKTQDPGRGRSGELTFRPSATDTYLLSVRLSARATPPEGQPPAAKASVATAVMYK